MAVKGSDETAKWIWAPGYNDYYHDTPGKFVLFRKSITLNEEAKVASVINVTGDTRYRLLVNGHSVSFGPCKSYPGRWFYDTVDISAYLTIGVNTISARVLRFSAAQIGSTSIMKATIPGFLLWGTIAGEPIITDDSWRCTEDQSVRLLPRAEWNYLLGPPFLSLEEDVDISRQVRDWDSTTLDETLWSQAMVSTMVTKMMPALEPWRLTARPIPLLPEIVCRFKSALKVQNSTTVAWNALIAGKGEVEIANGQEVVVELEAESLTTGFLNWTFFGGAGTEIKFLYAESYEKDLGIDTSPFPRPRSKGPRRDFENGRLYGFQDRIVLHGAEGEKCCYEPFWFRTFRFVRISIKCAEKPLRVAAVTYRETHYPLEISTGISLPKGLSDVWNISCRTLKNCMHETYEDCPYYEQNQFTMDARLQMLFTYQLSRDDRLARKTMHEFYASRRDDGLLETNYPMSFRAVNLPQFSLYWILMIHDHMMYFGDKSLVRSYIGTVDGILDHFQCRVNEDGLVGAFDPESWAFVDWVKEWQGPKGIRDMAVPPIYKKTGVAAFNSLLYSYILQHAAELCDFINRPDTAREYRRKADELNEAVNKTCYDGHFYVDGPGTTDRSQHTQIFAVLSGAVAGEAARNLMEIAMVDKSLPQCSFAMKFYIFRALEKVRLYEKWFTSMIQPWNEMVANSLTTCPEDDVNFRSDCHGWSASPIYEFTSQLYGVSPAAPGYKRVRLEPRRELLKEGKATICLPDGKTFAVSWSAEGPVKMETKSDVEIEFVEGEGEGLQVVRLENS